MALFICVQLLCLSLENMLTGISLGAGTAQVHKLIGFYYAEFVM